MVTFRRAQEGAASRRFPEIDDVGSYDLGHPDEHGPITSAMQDLHNVTVRVDRTEISFRAKLFAVSAAPKILDITKPRSGELANEEIDNIEFAAVGIGRASVEIRYGSLDGPVLSRLYVEIYERIPIFLLPHIVHIVRFDAHGNVLQQKDPPRVFFGRTCPTFENKVDRLRWLVEEANEIWIPHGIELVIPEHDESVIDTFWDATQLGPDYFERTDASGLGNPNHGELEAASALSPSRSNKRINVYCLPSMNSVGATFPPGNTVPFDYERPSNGILMDSSFRLATGRTLAHEMGHYLGLEQHSVSDLIPDVATRDDSVTRRRLMYPADELSNVPYRWRTAVGDGIAPDHNNFLAGHLLTYRTLPPSQDPTFGESQRARKGANAAGLYA